MQNITQDHFILISHFRVLLLKSMIARRGSKPRNWQSDTLNLTETPYYAQGSDASSGLRQ
jgi:hypothetical protein